MADQEKVQDPRDLHTLHERLHQLGIPHKCEMYEKAGMNAKQVIDWQRYKGLQSVLNSSLGQYHAGGFRLMVRRGSQFLVLYYCDQFVRVFSPEDATVTKIREACATYLRQGTGT